MSADIDRRNALRRTTRALAAMATMPSLARVLEHEAAQPAALVTRSIPSSGERLPVIGVGTARRYETAATEADKAPLRDVVRTLPTLGGRVIDTAPSYGQAESIVGELVADVGNRDRLFIATKVGRGRQGRDAGIAEMEESFRKLRVSRLDLMQVHNMSGVPEMLPVLRDWKQQGRIRYVGLTTSFDRQYADIEAAMRKETLDFVQVDYAIDDRAVEERILPLAHDRGMAVMTNLPFGRGRVFEKLGKQPIPEWARELGIATWAQFALKYVVSHPAVTVAIPGTAKVSYLEDNLGAARGPMPDETTRAKMRALVDG